MDDRGHRKSIFSSDFSFAGVGISETNKHYLIVINYCSNDLKIRTGNEKEDNVGLKNNTQHNIMMNDL